MGRTVWPPCILIEIQVIIAISEDIPVHSLGIEDLVSYLRIETDTEIEAFPQKAELQSTGKHRHRTAKISLVSLINHSVAIDIPVFEIARSLDSLLHRIVADIILRCEHAIYFISPECTYRITNLRPCGICPSHARAGNIVSALKFDDLIGNGGEIETYIIFEIFIDKIRPSQGQFHARVTHFAIIAQKFRRAASRRNRNIEHYIIRSPVVIVKFPAESVVEECKVDTRIIFAHNLPSEIILKHCLSTDSIHKILSEEARNSSSHTTEDHRRVSRHIVVAKHSPAQAKFQKVHHILLLHEWFGSKHPTKSHGREEAPFPVVFGTSVCSEGQCCQITVRIVICSSREEGNAVITIWSRRCVRNKASAVGTVAYVHRLAVICWDIDAGAVHCRKSFDPCRLSSHDTEGMPPDKVGVCDRIVDYMTVRLPVYFGKRRNRDALRTSHKVLRHIALGPVGLHIQIIRSLHLQLSIQKTQLGICREHQVRSFLAVFVISCHSIRIGIRITESIELRGIEFLRIGDLVGIIIYIVYRRIDKCLKESIRIR